MSREKNIVTEYFLHFIYLNEDEYTVEQFKGWCLDEQWNSRRVSINQKRYETDLDTFYMKWF